MDLSDQVLVNLRKIIRAIDLHSRSLVKRYGLTGPQLLILKEVSAAGEKSVGDIARDISLSQATVTDILDRLETKGLTSRSRSQADKRRMTVKVTDKGREVLRRNPSVLQEGFVDRFQELPDWEQSLLLSSIQRVASMMNADGLSDDPFLVGSSVREDGKPQLDSVSNPQSV